jgi:spermidine synthase
VERDDWFEETLHPSIRQRLKMGEVLHRDKTDLQDLIIFRNPAFGRVMALDGIVQTTEGDEFIYHEMLAHVPILAQQAVKGRVDRVLIVGGGDGGCLREVLKHKSLRCDMVEIDAAVIELSRRHLPNHSAGAFDHERARIIIADGARYVAETGERYDVVIIDSTDPVGPGAVLFTEQFYADCKRCMTTGGVLVTQNGVPFLQAEELQSSYRHFSRHYRDYGFYLAPVPTYNGGFMALGWATDNVRLRRAPPGAIERLYRRAALSTRYFNPEMFAAAFALPNFVRRLLDLAVPGGAASKRAAAKARPPAKAAPRGLKRVAGRRSPR